MLLYIYIGKFLEGQLLESLGFRLKSPIFFFFARILPPTLLHPQACSSNAKTEEAINQIFKGAARDRLVTCKNFKFST